MHFTLKQNPLRLEHLRDFVDAYRPDGRAGRVEPERFRRFAYDELIARKLGLDLVWLRDESLEDMDNLPPPDVIAREIVEDLEAALAETGRRGQDVSEPTRHDADQAITETHRAALRRFSARAAVVGRSGTSLVAEVAAVAADADDREENGSDPRPSE